MKRRPSSGWLTNTKRCQQLSSASNSESTRGGHPRVALVETPSPTRSCTSTKYCNSHLNDEENLVVPLAAQALTQEEWNSVGEHSRGSIPRDKLFIAFGMLLEPLSDHDRAYMLSEVPAPVKLLWKTWGQRSWRKYRAKLRNVQRFA